jgi:hypothetical protein
MFGACDTADDRVPSPYDLARAAMFRRRALRFVPWVDKCPLEDN